MKLSDIKVIDTKDRELKKKFIKDKSNEQYLCKEIVKPEYSSSSLQSRPQSISLSRSRDFINQCEYYAECEFRAEECTKINIRYTPIDCHEKID